MVQRGRPNFISVSVENTRIGAMLRIGHFCFRPIAFYPRYHLSPFTCELDILISHIVCIYNPCFSTLCSGRNKYTVKSNDNTLVTHLFPISVMTSVAWFRSKLGRMISLKVQSAVLIYEPRIIHTNLWRD